MYPGIALAKALMKHDPETDITFVGTERGLESRVLPREGFPLKTIQAGGLVGKKGIGRLTGVFKLPLGVLQSLGFLIGHRPHLVVGVGGYVSGPLVASAWMLRIPIVIHEQNAYPGVTNRILGKLANAIAVTFKESEKFFPANKVTETGNLIREEFTNAPEPAPHDPTQPFQVLIVGGSQGANSINRAMIDSLEHLKPFKDRLRFVHQTGEKDLDDVRKGYETHGFTTDVQPFIYDVFEAYRNASLVVCRSGAGTLSELTACGKASVLVPFPYAAHNHQVLNARVLEDEGAAEVILDHEVDGKQIANAIRNAIEQPDSLNQRAKNSFRLGRRDATQKVLAMCLQHLNSNN